MTTGADILEEKLRNLQSFPPPSIGARLEVIPLWHDNQYVLHAAIDVSPTRINRGQRFELGGVVVLRQLLPQGSKLKLVDGTDAREIRWNIESQGMAQRFPQSPNGAMSRFQINGVTLGRERGLEIRLGDGCGSETAIFRIGKA